jgi:hypothetical protein
MAEKAYDAGRLELTLERSALRGEAAAYTFALCGEVLFEARSADEVAGLHELEKPFVVGAGEHVLTITGRDDGETFEESFPIEVPKRMKEYVIGTVECRLEAKRRDDGPEDDVGFQLKGDPASAERMSAVAAAGGTSCCSVKA